MKRLWQIWLLFFGGLVLVVTAMGWLTAKVIELDRAEIAARHEARRAHRQEAEAFRQAELARRQTDLQDRISNALWQMDWTLTPLVAQEAARPYFVYQPFFSPNGKISVSRLEAGSPMNPGGKGKVRPTDDKPVQPTAGKAGQELLKHFADNELLPSPLLVPSEYVRVHFQLNPDNTWSSPQSPLHPTIRQSAKDYGATDQTIERGATCLTQMSQRIQHRDLLGLLPEQLIEPLAIANATDLNRNFNELPDDLLKNYGQNDGGQQAGQAGVDEQTDNSPVQVVQQFPRQAAAQGGMEQQIANLPQQQRERRPNAGVPNQSDDNPTEPATQLAHSAIRNRRLRGQYELDRQNLILRQGSTWQSRARGFQAYAQSSALQQRVSNTGLHPPFQHLAKEGVSQPLWFDGKLLLARRTLINNQTVIQGCWLDWTKLAEALTLELVDLDLPGAKLVPVHDLQSTSAGRMLVTLPVALEVREPVLADIPLDTVPNQGPLPTRWSAIRASLGLAWVCLFLGTGAVAILLQGVIKLSERRGAFVSAVTHELRTPLTTFRMYAEMLADGMVPSEQQRQQYLETLRVEADRLSHLVENVLQYARLERNRVGRKREDIAVRALVDRMQQRLSDRAAQAEMSLELIDDELPSQATVRTDPAAVEQIIFNLVDNACKYAVGCGKKIIEWRIRQDEQGLHLQISDEGPGIGEKATRRLFKPFSKSVHDAADSAPGVGLGLALSKRLAEDLGGRLQYTQRPTGGACFTLTLPVDSIPTYKPS